MVAPRSSGCTWRTGDAGAKLGLAPGGPAFEVIPLRQWDPVGWGTRHDWRGIPPRWNGDAGQAAVQPAAGRAARGPTGPSTVVQLNYITMPTVVKPEIIAEYKIHEKDTGSSEVQVALLTARINHLTEHLRTHRKDFHSRRGLLQMASRRRKLLDYLKQHNLPKYNELLQKLNLRK
jgi:small subunit ribosomal protein S15